jgi:hypothetical protein
MRGFEPALTLVGLERNPWPNFWREALAAAPRGSTRLPVVRDRQPRAVWDRRVPGRASRGSVQRRKKPSTIDRPTAEPKRMHISPS